MKPAQWMAVLLLALMVGGITFVMVYLGSSRGPVDTPPPKSTAGLTFMQKKYPAEGEKPPITEVNQDGHQDFWFVNDSGQKLLVGLLRKMECTCARAELTIAPQSWQSRWPEAAAGQVLQQASLLTPAHAVNGLQDLAAYAPELSESDVQTTLLTKENSVEVPAGAFGWVRLGWQRRDAKPFNTWAELWTGQRGDIPSARLEASVLITRPMEVNTDMAVGSFNVHDLKKGHKQSFLCWSATRPSFTIKAQLVHEGEKAESDPIEVGRPIPLTAEELSRFPMSEKTPLQILSGYRIPVTLHAQAKDGTPIDLGHFRRYINVSSDDAGIEPVQVKVTGTVHGDVTVGIKEGGAINLGPFNRSRGARGDIILQTDVKGLDLELDAARVPEYLKVRFPQEPEVFPGGHREWVLEVEVPPNKARGEFPRADDPVYRDSAIYVKTKGENPPRSIRVPVAGAANEG